MGPTVCLFFADLWKSNALIKIWNVQFSRFRQSSPLGSFHGSVWAPGGLDRCLTWRFRLKWHLISLIDEHACDSGSQGLSLKHLKSWIYLGLIGPLLVLVWNLEKRPTWMRPVQKRQPVSKIIEHNSKWQMSFLLYD